MQQFVEIVGTMIVGAVSMRAAYSAISFAGRKYALSRENKKYISQFRAAASRVFRSPPNVQSQAQPLTWKGKRRFRVVKRVYENINEDVCSFYLEPHDGKPIPPFHPGQFLTFAVPAAGQKEPEMRCYSLSETPTAKGYYRVTIKRLDAPYTAPSGTPPGRVSNHFHNALQPGAVVETLAPAGAFRLDQTSNRPIIFIGGGIGITPLLSMLRWLIATRSRREIWFFYGVRNRGEHVMYETLQKLNAHTPNVRLLVAYSQPTPTCRKNVDYHVKGHISAELLRPLLERRNCEIYLCGPNAMMASLRGQLEAIGVPGEDIRTESFGHRAADTAPDAKKESQTGAEPKTGFRIEFARSGRTITWTPRDGTILELAIDNDIKARCSCRQGVCGTCAVKLKDGKIAYRQQPQCNPEPGKCLPCIAKPTSDVVVDL
ncbi:MAG: 2Fe-2S iron-sulfur cluster-binding protein [Hyphomicrobiaceae bacterium]|nr:2Fe-2S iron-sulfur cluster-binding protein [Hyphomicrobiaceae bacterium]